MKRIHAIIAFAISVMFIGCSKDNVNNQGTAKVHVVLDDFAITQDDFDAKASIAGYSGVKAVTLAFFNANDSMVYCVTQLRANASNYTTFGEFDLALPIGSYTMEVLGYGSTQPITVNSKTNWAYTADKVRETFAATQTVNVTTTADVEVSAALNRIIAKLEIHSTDGCPASADSLRIAFSGGSKGVDPITGYATVDTGWVNSVAISADPGEVTGTANYLFLVADQQTMDVTIDVIDDNGDTISHKEVSNVPMQRNRITKLTGSLYTANDSTAFTLNTSWSGDTINVSF